MHGGSTELSQPMNPQSLKDQLPVPRCRCREAGLEAHVRALDGRSHSGCKQLQSAVVIAMSSNLVALLEIQLPARTCFSFFRPFSLVAGSD